MALLGTSIAAAGGGTKHRVKRNRRRTVKAAATYGAAYRKYNRMYGGATDDPLPAPPAPTDEENKQMAAIMNRFLTLSPDLYPAGILKAYRPKFYSLLLVLTIKFSNSSL